MIQNSRKSKIPILIKFCTLDLLNKIVTLYIKFHMVHGKVYFIYGH